jgi:outer membrane autotransporter protein
VQSSTANFVVSYTLPSTGLAGISYDNSANATDSVTIVVTCGASSSSSVTKDTVANLIAGHWNPLLSVFSEHRTPLPFQDQSVDDVFQDGSGIEPTVTGGGGQVAFATSIKGLRNHVSRNEVVEAVGAGAPARERQRWDLWVKGVYTDFDFDASGAARKGDAFVGLMGVDYLVSDGVLVGVLVGYDTSEQKMNAQNLRYETDGFVVGPYASFRLDKELTLYIRGAWGEAENDLRVGTTTGEFDSERWLVMANLKGTYWDFRPVRLTPNLMLQYVTEHQEAFTDSTGARVGSQNVSLGRLELGGEVGYRHEFADGMIVDPYLSFHGIWDFDHVGTLAISPTVSVKQDDLRARAGAGVTVSFGNGAHAQLGVAYDGIGADHYEAVSGHIRVAIPLD